MEQKILIVKRYDPEMVREKPNYLFIFGDNLFGRGKGGQAIIRDEPNAYGIPTKKRPDYSPESFMTDEELEENKQHIMKAIDDMPINQYDVIVFPEDGLGTGLARLPELAPKTFEFLVNILNEKFNNVYEGM